MDDIINIKNLWEEANDEWKDMCALLSFVEKKNKILLEKRPIKDKLILLITDMREFINSMEKICSAIDDIYTDKGTIVTKLNEEKNIYAERINDDGRVLKVIAYR